MAQEPQSRGVGCQSMETLGAMAPGGMGPWRHGSMGGHGGRVERGAERAGMQGPFKVI